ncbi:MAG TPA: response regulator transcription factor [Thermoanaerobaculaceae bacterium]|nr:response regulator transcription factor [Thermoanaerobaculaceae bacterium]
MPERVLIIDDDRKLAGMLVEYLRPRGLDADVAGDAARGLSELGRRPYDAVVLDVMLPDLDGFEVCRRLRAGSDVPILMLTARGDPEDRVVGLELGADDYLPKPFDPRELLARLRAIIRRRRTATSAAPGVLHFGRLEIDPAARQVRIGGEARPLTGYQFDILHLLARHAGRVLSRDAILERLRSDPGESFDRSIDVHVSRIRAAIEEDPHHPHRLVTVRGAGYQLVHLPGDDLDGSRESRVQSRECHRPSGTARKDGSE